MLLVDEELAGDTLALVTVLGDGVPELGVGGLVDLARFNVLANTEVVLAAADVDLV